MLSGLITFMRCYVITDNFNYTYASLRYELLQPNLPLICSNTYVENQLANCIVDDLCGY